MLLREVRLSHLGAAEEGDHPRANSGGRTVVICGSMKNYELMSKICRFLQAAGLGAVAPDRDEPIANQAAETPQELKRDASRRHMRRIRQDDTAAILVVNVDRPGAQDYVGPNAFAEIGVAFSDEREVFLLKGMPASYAEELAAWGVKCLNGDIRPLLQALAAPAQVNLSDWTATVQCA